MRKDGQTRPYGRARRGLFTRVLGGLFRGLRAEEVPGSSPRTPEASPYGGCAVRFLCWRRWRWPCWSPLGSPLPCPQRAPTATTCSRALSGRTRSPAAGTTASIRARQGVREHRQRPAVRRGRRRLHQVPLPKRRGIRGDTVCCGTGRIYVALDGALAGFTPPPVQAHASARFCPPRAGPASVYSLTKKPEARTLFAYMVLLNVIRSFWAREGSPENSRPVRGALRNSL